MQKTALIYWPKGGNVEKIANKIYNRFNDSDIAKFDLDTLELSDLEGYDLYIMGGSTVGAPVWQEAYVGEKWGLFHKKLLDANSEVFKGKSFAIYGLGDQILYPNDFVDNIKILADRFEALGAENIGHWHDDGYEFNDSKAFIDDRFLGLALDEENQAEQSDERIDKWLGQIRG